MFHRQSVLSPGLKLAYITNKFPLATENVQLAVNLKGLASIVQCFSLSLSPPRTRQTIHDLSHTKQSLSVDQMSSGVLSASFSHFKLHTHTHTHTLTHTYMKLIPPCNRYLRICNTMRISLTTLQLRGWYRKVRSKLAKNNIDLLFGCHGAVVDSQGEASTYHTFIV